MKRKQNRLANELRPLEIISPYLEHAEGSALIKLGRTHVLCTASVMEGVPRFLKDSKQGWLTAEYGMLPRATHERSDRESARGKQTGRTIEIQRLIGRCLRNCMNLKLLGNYTIAIDCDVIQADGGTRTAAINGSCIALIQALQHMQYNKMIEKDPMLHLIAAVSIGVKNNKVLLDLDYEEDSAAETDMNLVMTEHGDFVEIQGTAEGLPLKANMLNDILALAKHSTADIINKQKQILGVV